MQPLASLPLSVFLEQLAAKQPTPGGGATAGATGALACALAEMVVSYSVGKKSLAQHTALLDDAKRRLPRAREIMLTLAEEDAQAYGLVNELQKLPESDARRVREMPAAAAASVRVPLAVGACALDACRVAHTLVGASNQHLRSDLAIAAVLFEACARSARWNVVVNVPLLPDERERVKAREDADSYAAQTAAIAARIEEGCA